MASDARFQTQCNTPKDWIMNGRMFRIKSWEIEEPEIRNLFDTIVKHSYLLNIIRGKDGETKGITLLYLSDLNDVEKVRTTLLITSSGTELRKVSHIQKRDIISRTIKTTAPIWVTKAKIFSIFSIFNSDPETYNICNDKVVMTDVQYPLIRFYPKTVTRDGKIINVNVIYVEFSPKTSCHNDSFVALSMSHRTEVKNNISGEKATLIFDKWTVEKTKPIMEKDKIQVKRIVDRIY